MSARTNFQKIQDKVCLCGFLIILAMLSGSMWANIVYTKSELPSFLFKTTHKGLFSTDKSLYAAGIGKFVSVSPTD